MDPVNIPAKFEVRNFTRSWDNRGYSKIGAVPVYAHAPFSPKLLIGFVRMNPLNISAKFDVRSFTRSWNNRGTQKIGAVPGYAHAPFSPKILKDFCSHGPCEYICQVWSS